jgi:hypothetical protein
MFLRYEIRAFRLRFVANKLLLLAELHLLSSLLADTLPSLLAHAREPCDLSCHRHSLVARFLVFHLPLLFLLLLFLLMLALLLYV